MITSTNLNYGVRTVADTIQEKVSYFSLTNFTKIANAIYFESHSILTNYLKVKSNQLFSIFGPI